jgi:hypothetical protein
MYINNECDNSIILENIKINIFDDKCDDIVKIYKIFNNTSISNS